MAIKFSVDGFTWIENRSKFNKNFQNFQNLENYNGDSNEEYFFEVDVQYLEKLHDLCNFSFLLERMKVTTAEKTFSQFV